MKLFKLLMVKSKLKTLTSAKLVLSKKLALNQNVL